MKRSRGLGLFAVVMGGLLSAGWSAYAAEHGGQEHGGAATAPAAKEHGGSAQEHGGNVVKAEPSAEQIRQTITRYVEGIVEQKGAFAIDDPVTATTRQLEFVRVHERVGKTGSLYYSCTDMRDKQTGELLDLDFDVKTDGETLAVVDQRIHKVSGQARYTYDEHDNRISLTPKTDAQGQGSEQTY